MDFTQLGQDIQLNCFNYLLPPCVTKPSQQEQAGDSNNQTKRKKFEAERNNNIVREWKLQQNESWNSIFMNKTNHGPTLSFGCKTCLKFQVKGLCYSDCKHITSHTVLKDDDKIKIDKYIKELRGE